MIKKNFCSKFFYIVLVLYSVAPSILSLGKSTYDQNLLNSLDLSIYVQLEKFLWQFFCYLSYSFPPSMLNLCTNNYNGIRNYSIFQVLLIAAVKKPFVANFSTRKFIAPSILSLGKIIEDQN